jgi:hypothetical protein
MISTIPRVARVGGAILIGIILAVGSGSDAFAKAGKRHSHYCGHVSEGRARLSGKPVRLARQQPALPGPMRYYGGPKSPMWRGPVDN